MVKGTSRSLICDLQRRDFEFIPNSLAELFDSKGVISITEVHGKFDSENTKIFNEYIEFLNKNEFIFYCNELELKTFPSLSLEWDFPSKISNMIIDIDSYSAHDYERIINFDIQKIGCRYLQFRRYDESTIEEWDGILEKINNSAIKTIDIILKFSPNNFSFNELSNWSKQNLKIRSIVLHSAPYNKVFQELNSEQNVIVAIKQLINSNLHCGIINSSYFITNIETYTESINHNTCLNRKIAIDKDGNIKNCPSMSQSFGNIKDTSLEEAINHPDFKKYWNVTKDEIEVCKDCEFRHICTDCRAYTERTHFKEEIDLSKPLKCGYNPYTNEWSEWSTNPLKQKAIEFYNMQEFVKND